MDPITAAIVAALVAGVTDSITEVGKNTLVDAYTKLKDMLEQKFGKQSKVVKSLKDLEGEPDSKGYKTVLQEQVAKCKADKDIDLLQAAQVLQSQLKTYLDDGHHYQSATGSYIAQADRGSTASVNVGHPKKA